MKADQLRRLLKKKDRMITLRMNPELLRLLDEALAPKERRWIGTIDASNGRKTMIRERTTAEA